MKSYKQKMSDRSKDLKSSKKSFGRRKSGLPKLSLGQRNEEKGNVSGGSSVRRGPGTNTAQLGSEFNGTQFNHFPEMGQPDRFVYNQVGDRFQLVITEPNLQNRMVLPNANRIGDGNSNAEGASQRVPSVSHSKTSRKKVDDDVNNPIGIVGNGSGRRLGRDGSSQFTGSLGLPLEPGNRVFKQLSGGGASYNDFPLNSLGGNIMRPDSFLMTPTVNQIPSKSRMGPETGDGRTITNSFFREPIPLKPVKSTNKKDSRKSFGCFTNIGTIVERSEYSKTQTMYTYKTSERIAEEARPKIIKKISESKDRLSKSRSRRKSIKKKGKKLNLKLNKSKIENRTNLKEGPKSILKKTPINGPKTRQSRKSVRFDDAGSAVFEFPVERNYEEKFQTLIEKSNQQSF